MGKNFINISARVTEQADFGKTIKGINEVINGNKKLADSMDIIKNGFNEISRCGKEYEQLAEFQRKVNSESKIYTQLEDKKNTILSKQEAILSALSKLNNKEINNMISTVRQTQNFNKELNKEIQLRQQNIKLIQEEAKAAQKAKEAGAMTKSLLQNETLDTKGSKRTQAQVDYQTETLRRNLDAVRDFEKEYKHALDSMSYETKHVAGKSLYEDSIQGVKELTQAENKRFQAQKSGQKIMEQYYDSEIKKQKESLEQIQKIATGQNPEKMKQYLLDNKNLIMSQLNPEDAVNFEKNLDVNRITTLWSQGMAKYVQQAIDGINRIRVEHDNMITQTTRTQNYKEILNTQQQIYSMEERIAKLQKDPAKHQNEIANLQSIVTTEQQRITQLKQQISLTNEEEKELKDLERQHEQNRQQIKAQNEDWRNNQKAVSELGDTIHKVFNYVIVYRGFFLLQQGIRQAIDTMKELDKAFTDIQMVTGDTDEQTAELAQNYNALAKEMGSTTQEVAEGASEWLRQGKTTEETTQLLKASMTLSKVGAIESSEATELLTSSLNGYKLAAQDAMSIVDKISGIDLAAATSSYELATALARTANSADDAGVSFDRLLAMIGTVSSVTRKSASTIRRKF